MTIDEVIDKLKMLRIAQELQAKAFSEDGKPLEPDFEIAVNMAIEALEKRKHKKPIRITYVDGGAEEKCPNCNKRLCAVFANGDTYDGQRPYCHWCGQALDWSEEE